MLHDPEYSRGKRVSQNSIMENYEYGTWTIRLR